MFCRQLPGELKHKCMNISGQQLPGQSFKLWLVLKATLFSLERYAT